MQYLEIIQLLLGLLIALQPVPRLFFPDNPLNKEQQFSTIQVAAPPPDDLKTEAFRVLELKCNSCQRKQNPFMVFNEKNMVKRAPKIYKAVYVDRRMPKGDDIKLSDQEYDTLKEW
ncbi:MAG: hypothetical protein KDC44_22720, partial [Phaeodactylibacter sp.]|nr:hypothetical protein [Phaeodactylibacter sp.]